jgi:CO/xanthine dehydrogenase Mo-binding subunit
VPGRVARGRVDKIHTGAAERAPGVIAVITHENAPRMKKTEVFGSASDSDAPGAASSTIPYLNTDEIYFYGQPVAVVGGEGRAQRRRGGQRGVRRGEEKIHGLVGEDEASPLIGTRFDEVEFRDGGIYHKTEADRGETFAAILRQFEIDKIEAEGEAAPGADAAKYAMGSYGAQFCEVRVDEETGEVRVARFLGVFDCGRIINPKTASSQLGM